MAVIYQCRYCGHEIGRLNHRALHTSVLGFDQLTRTDQKHMIQYLKNGDMQINTICENCEDTLEHDPHYWEMDSFLQ